MSNVKGKTKDEDVIKSCYTSINTNNLRSKISSMNFKFIFMSIIVLGLIVNTSSFSDFAFAGQSDKEAAKEAREQAKEDREKIREDAKEAREQAKEDTKEFRDGVDVTSSSLSGSEKVTICHIPPGNPANAHTITVGSPAVSAHMAHGDLEGSCGSGDIISDDDESKKESRLSESSEKESKALERAEKLIEKLEKQIANLEERLQTLLEKYESGEYYGNISTVDAETNSYVISFEGTASSIYDESVTSEMSGKLFMENQVTTSNTSKFKVLSGEIIIGNNVHDVAFGKARASTEDNSLVMVMQTIDSEENNNTIKITLGFESSINEELGISSEEFEILDNSKVSGQWILDGNGQLSIES